MKTRLLRSEWIVSILLFTLLVTSATATQTETYQVGAGLGNGGYINMDSGDRFSGSFSVSGGDGSIAYMVFDPSNGVVTSTNGIVYSGGGIVFTASISGTYRITFYNGANQVTKTVVLTYDVYRQENLLNSGLLWVIIGLVALLVAIIGLLIVLSRRKNKSKVNQPPSSNSQRAQ